MSHMAEASKTGSGQTGIFSSSLTLNIVLFYRNSTVSYGGKKSHNAYKGFRWKGVTTRNVTKKKKKKPFHTVVWNILSPFDTGICMVFMTYHVSDKNNHWPNCLELEIYQRKAINQSNIFQVSSVCSTLYSTLWDMTAHTSKFFGKQEVNVK